MKALYVGTYTDPKLFSGQNGMAGRAEGIYRLAFDAARGTLALAQTYGGISNPSYLALTGDGRRLYCIHELDTFQGTKGGGASGFAIEADGSLRPLNTRPTHGAAACHVSIHPAEGLVAASSYSGGSLSAFAADKDGMLGEAQVIRHTGRGPNPTRQTQPHVHSALFTPSGNHLIVADLGTDTLTVYPVKGQALAASESRAVSANPGDGPRLCAYDAGRNLLYVVCEMTCRIATFACDGDGAPVALLHSTPTLPGEILPGSTASDVHLSADGRFLYASTRGQDALSVFTVAQDGSLALVQCVESGGRTPRAFTLSPCGGWLLCGHQDSDTIVIFAVDSKTGTLTQHASFPLPSPVCLLFAP